MGKSAFELTPVYEALIADLKRPTKLFMPSRQIAAQSPARHCIAKYWDGVCLFLSDGRIEMDNNAPSH